jgi:hypothetical protein
LIDEMTLPSLWQISLALALAPAGAFGFELAFPVDCALDETCYIQHLPHRDPGPGAQDFACGSLTYDQHNGTDIALPTRADMAVGVAVLAAAAGVVRGQRDGVEDFLLAVEGRECGNGVVIDHDGDWQTQYCHLRQGSVQVTSGQSVAAGDVLGLIGQSGLANFPHLHLRLWRDGEDVDPFNPDAAQCASPASAPIATDLWADPIAYTLGGILKAGFADQVPEYEAINAGLDVSTLPTTAPALVAWVYFYATLPGDAVIFEISGPDGDFLTERSLLERPQALSFRAVGRKLRDAGRSEGSYSAEIRLMRGDVALDSIKAVVQISAP